MRRSLDFALPAGAPATRRTGCGRCGDSFSGSAADGREWLAAHVAVEHAAADVVTLRTPAVRATPRLRESVG